MGGVWVIFPNAMFLFWYKLEWLLCLLLRLNRLSPFCKAIYTIHFHLFLPGIASIMCVVAIYNTFFKQTTFEVNKSYLATARNSSPSKNSSEFYCNGLMSIENPLRSHPITNSSCWTHFASCFKSVAKILILMYPQTNMKDDAYSE